MIHAFKTHTWHLALLLPSQNRAPGFMLAHLSFIDSLLAFGWWPNTHDVSQSFNHLTVSCYLEYQGNQGFRGCSAPGVTQARRDFHWMVQSRRCDFDGSKTESDTRSIQRFWAYHFGKHLCEQRYKGGNQNCGMLPGHWFLVIVV